MGYTTRWLLCRGRTAINAIEGEDAARFLTKCKKSITELDEEYQDGANAMSAYEDMCGGLKTELALPSLFEFVYVDNLEVHQMHAAWRIIRRLVRSPWQCVEDFAAEVARCGVGCIAKHPLLAQFISAVVLECDRIEEKYKEPLQAFAVGGRDAMDVSSQ